MTLKMTWEYDHASGLFEVALENGARFKVTRSDIGGKLENTLTLYRRAVVSLLEDKPVRKTSKNQERREIMELSAGRSPEVIAARAQRKDRKIIHLDDLEINPELEK